MGAVVAVHGGAGRLSRRAKQRKEKVLREVKAAMEEAMKALRGGSALDAVVEAVSYMEDCSEFNAGKGSVMTMAGTIELDAGVMWGRDLTVGAVGALKGAWNAIRVARGCYGKDGPYPTGRRGSRQTRTFIRARGASRTHKAEGRAVSQATRRFQGVLAQELGDSSVAGLRDRGCCGARQGWESGSGSINWRNMV